MGLSMEQRNEDSSENYRACVASGSVAASQAGIDILNNGGNAADAAAAMILTLSVTNLGTTCLGGEAAGIAVNAADSRPRVICGQGAAPLSTTLKQWEAVSRKGGIREATTPALFGYVCELLKEFGTSTLQQASCSALLLLREGRPAAHKDSVIRQFIDTLSGGSIDPGTATTEVPPRKWWVDLAATLDRSCSAETRARGSRQEALSAACDEFYNGRTAAMLNEWYLRQQAFLSISDLNNNRAVVEEPVTTRYGDFEIHKCGPWTQGPMLNLALQMLEAANIADMDYGSTDYLHTVIESTKAAMADRNHYMADPKYVDVPLAELLDSRYAGCRAALIEADRATKRMLPGDPRALSPIGAEQNRSAGVTDASTVCCLVSDRWGNFVVTTPSGVASTAGSGGHTGITHGTRMRAFSTDIHNPNVLEPGKRPCTTLSPTIVTRHGRVVMGISTPGGDYQDQIALQLVLKAAHRGLAYASLASDSGLDAPVAVRLKTQDTEDSIIVNINETMPEKIQQELSSRGHHLHTAKIDLKNLGGGLIFWDEEESNYRVIGHAAASID